MLDENSVTKKIPEGFTIVDNNACMKIMYMAMPLKGVCSRYKYG